MKKTFLLLSAIIPAVSHAQIDIADLSVAKVKDRVEIRFEVFTERGAVRGPWKLVGTPFLYHGTDTLWLESFEVLSRTRLRRERQDYLLATGRRDFAPGDRQALAGDTIVYTASAPYRRWMRDSHFSYRSETVGCSRCKHRATHAVARNLPVYAVPRPVYTAANPDPKHFQVTDVRRRWVFEREEMKIDFPVSRTELHPDLYDNRRTLDEIVEAIRKLLRRVDRSLSAIEIYGFASPEGPVGLNRKLGDGRAETLKRYIRSRVPELTDEQFSLVNGVENWDGLRRMVAASSMPDRDRVLEIIDNVLLEQGRKSRLMALDGGRPYRYMLRNFYPLLRNACYISVYYDVLRDTAADRINEANELIRGGEYLRALELLEPLGDDPRAYNPTGVCLMMLEREPEAIVWFEKALEAGVPQARENLDQLR